MGNTSFPKGSKQSLSPMAKIHEHDGEGIEDCLHRMLLGRKKESLFMIYTVLCIGLLGFLQLLVYENRWGWGQSELQEIASSSKSLPWGLRTLSKDFSEYTQSNIRQGFSEFSQADGVDAQSGPTTPQKSDTRDLAACVESRLKMATNQGLKPSNVEKLKAECFQDRNLANKNTNNIKEEQDDVVDPDLGDTTETNQPYPPVEYYSKNELLENFMPENTFLPMKDVKYEGLTDTDTNWFMSRLRGRPQNGSAESFDLPLDDFKGRFLCISGNNDSDGTGNSYGLFNKEALPSNSMILKGTTLIADNYWDYQNPWHSMSAMVNFATWRVQNRCEKPERVLLYHWGELITSMGSWITNVLQASLGQNIPVETLVNRSGNPVCFERAVIQRRGLGGIDRSNMNALFDTLRCKVRKYCGYVPKTGNTSKVDVVVLTRTGPRAFVNASGVVAVVEHECTKIEGCNTRALNIADLTFCEQVELMSSTDVLITAHGAQLTNMMFMSPGARVMEMFPKGWLEFAGIGQEIYKWLADWTQVVHEGAWRDAEGPDCPYPKTETLPCLLFFKDREVGLNATYLAQWTGDVLKKYIGTQNQLKKGDAEDSHCPCDEEDGYNILKNKSNLD